MQLPLDMNEELFHREVDYSGITPYIKKFGPQRCLLSISSLASMKENFSFLPVINDWIFFIRSLLEKVDNSTEKLNMDNFKKLVLLFQEVSVDQLYIYIIQEETH